MSWDGTLQLEKISLKHNCSLQSLTSECWPLACTTHTTCLAQLSAIHK